MRLLVLGYYNKGNLGDELFKDAFANILSDHELEFIDINSLVAYDPASQVEPRLSRPVGQVDAVICGGGDIFNDYFLPRIHLAKRLIEVPFYAIGVGIEYPSVIDRGDLDIFEYVLLREVSDLRHLQQRLGSTSVGTLPDLTFRLTPPVIEADTKNDARIGLCLVQGTPSALLSGINKMLPDLASIGSLVGIPLNTEIIDGKPSGENDTLLLESLGLEVLRAESGTFEGMIKTLAGLRMVICQRYHSMTLAIVAGVPFVAWVTTRKAELFMKETGYTWWTKDPSKIPKLARTVSQNLPRTRNLLRSLRDRLTGCWKTEKIRYLIERKVTRTPFNTTMTLHDPEMELLVNRVFTSLDEGKDPKIVAEEMCWGVTKMVGSSYVCGSVSNLRDVAPLGLSEKIERIRSMVQWVVQDHARNTLAYANRLDLTFMNQDIFRGFHRAGWQFVSDAMMSLSANGGAICDTYLDRTFHWGADSLERLGVLPYLSPWIGFIHHGANDLAVKYSGYNTRELIKHPLFKLSLPSCRGLITLSEDLATWLRRRVHGVLIISLYHPTVTVRSITSLHPARRLFHIGAWYRNLVSFYKIESPLPKIALKGRNMDSTFPPKNGSIDYEMLSARPTESKEPSNRFMWLLIRELRSQGDWKLKPGDVVPLFGELASGSPKRLQRLKGFLDRLLGSVEIITEVDNVAYDKIMEENVVFLDLIDASAVNVVIECMVRNTPLLINPLPAVKEYLGEDYPLFYHSLGEVPELLQEERLQAGIDYLRQLDKRKLQIDYFMDALRSSQLYKNLNKELTSLSSPTQK